MHQVILAYHVLADGDIELGEELAAYKSIPSPSYDPGRWGPDRRSRIG